MIIIFGDPIADFIRNLVVVLLEVIQKRKNLTKIELGLASAWILLNIFYVEFGFTLNLVISFSKDFLRRYRAVYDYYSGTQTRMKIKVLALTYSYILDAKMIIKVCYDYYHSSCIRGANTTNHPYEQLSIRL